MATDYQTWRTNTDATLFEEMRGVGLVLDILRHLKRTWPTPQDVAASTTESDREAARADAIHRGWQSLTAAELDAEALLRSLRATMYRLERGELPFTLPPECLDSPEQDVPVGPI